MGLRRARLALAGGAISVVMAVAGVAWACTESAYVEAAPNNAAPGSQVTVTGSQFGEAPVSIHWASPDGQTLANTAGPRFNVTVTVPQTASGTYYLFAVQSGEAPKAAPLTVTGPEPAEPPPAQEAPAPPQPTAADPAPGDTTPAEQPSDPAPAATAGPASSQERASTQARVPRPAGAAGSARPIDRPATNAPAPAPASAGLEGSEGQPPASGPLPSARSVAGDLWSGFGSGTAQLPGPGLGAETPSSPQRSGLFAGIVLLAIGLTAMALGAGVALRRRPRAQARV